LIKYCRNDMEWEKVKREGYGGDIVIGGMARNRGNAYSVAYLFKETP
jgi:hypothetical protein